MFSVPSVYREVPTVVGGNGVTVSSNVPAPSGTSTSRVTTALFGYTVTPMTRLVANFTPAIGPGEIASLFAAAGTPAGGWAGTKLTASSPRPIRPHKLTEKTKR